VKSSKQLRSTLSGHTGAVTAIAFSRYGSRVATGSLDGAAKVWDVSSAGNPKELYSFSHATGVVFVDLSPDGGLLATVSADGYVRVYRLNIDIDDLMSLAKKRVHRNLTPAECKLYMDDGRCPPLGKSATQ
jgi:WD40 repeat protein